MPIWRVRGGERLDGRAWVQGAKNAVLPIMAASLLANGETVLENCPSLLDVAASVEILRHLGCRVRHEAGKIYIDSRGVCETAIPHELMLKMRSSVMYMGAILARAGQVRLSTPGGCELGSRPIDLHLKALRELGAEISEEGGEVFCRAAELKGTHINLDFPSVGATENIMLAACAAKGTTVITNAAREPEIADLQLYLQGIGARISGAGTSVITIEGFNPGKSTDVFSIMPDRIAAATYLCAAAAAGGDVCVKKMHPQDIETLITQLRDMGCEIHLSEGEARIISNKRLKAARPVITKPYPGFPTDAQALLMASCLKAEGTSVFVENIFENRYRHTDEMRRLGADIKTEGRVAMISGVEKLRGARVAASDLRGGAALILAGLAAEGETIVSDTGHIRRGYDGLELALRGIGANISCLEE